MWQKKQLCILGCVVFESQQLYQCFSILLFLSFASQAKYHNTVSLTTQPSIPTFDPLTSVLQVVVVLLVLDWEVGLAAQGPQSQQT